MRPQPASSEMMVPVRLCPKCLASLLPVPRLNLPLKAPVGSQYRIVLGTLCERQSPYLSWTCRIHSFVRNCMTWSGQSQYGALRRSAEFRTWRLQGLSQARHPATAARTLGETSGREEDFQATTAPPRHWNATNHPTRCRPLVAISHAAKPGCFGPSPAANLRRAGRRCFPTRSLPSWKSRNPQDLCKGPSDHRTASARGRCPTAKIPRVELPLDF